MIQCADTTSEVAHPTEPVGGDPLQTHGGETRLRATNSDGEQHQAGNRPDRIGLVSITEAAARLAITRHEVKQRIAAGELEAWDIAGRSLVPLWAVLACSHEQGKPPARAGDDTDTESFLHDLMQGSTRDTDEYVTLQQANPPLLLVLARRGRMMVRLVTTGQETVLRDDHSVLPSPAQDVMVFATDEEARQEYVRQVRVLCLPGDDSA
jgi:hypothetical protein